MKDGGGKTREKGGRIKGESGGRRKGNVVRENRVRRDKREKRVRRDKREKCEGREKLVGREREKTKSSETKLETMKNGRGKVRDRGEKNGSGSIVGMTKENEYKYE